MPDFPPHFSAAGIAVADAIPETLEGLHIFLDSVSGDPALKRAAGTGVSEALLNVNHHAGTPDDRPPWSLDCYFVDQSILDVSVRDRGRGIPATIGKIFPDEKDHGRLIALAHGKGVTCTGDAHRGLGLPIDIRGVVDRIGNDIEYFVYSRNGWFHEIRKDGERSDAAGRSKYPVVGTDVRWRIRI